MQQTLCQMNFHRTGPVEYLTFPALEAVPMLRHAFSTRSGGVSPGAFSSMNLSFGRGDPDENVLENYRRFCAAAGFEFESLVLSAQDHHTVVRAVTRADRGRGILRARGWQSVDGLMTNEPGVTLVTHYADCVPLYFVDPVKKVIALSHAGWRGTVAQMARVTVEAMEREYGCRAQDLLAAIGPSAGPCCYEVDETVAAPVRSLELQNQELLLRETGNGKFHLDLWGVNREIILRAGVLPEHISTAGVCTCCCHQLLYSHRVTGGSRGGLAAFLALC